jgi:DNA-binding IclR family transcriptional regulator
MKSAKTAPKQVLVLQKTLDILETLKKESNGIALADVARSLDMPKATVYRILATLEIRGYLDRVTNGGYKISDKFFALQRDLSPGRNLLRVAEPIMEQVAAECRETVNLGTFDGGEVVVIATVESPQSVRMASKVGNRRHLHTTGLGKVLMASMTDQAIRRLIQMKGLPKLTPHSLTTQTALLAEIHKVRKLGYALDNQENEMEGRCIAMQIPGVEGMNAALSISGPVFRTDMRRLRGLTPILRRGCDKIAKAINS